MKPGLPPDAFLNASVETFRTRLLSWFDENRRDLPWRNNRTLYGTWISEMMLQQTTVAVVVPYWHRFLAAFPDVVALATAPEDQVLSLWSGLGYYRRARQLHAAARKVVAESKGALPADRDGWLELPGVGPYASGAIASIGLNARVPAIDANARRVLSRWLLADPDGLAGLKPAHLEEVGASLVDPVRPGAWNEALMELGALVCRSGEPRCDLCPIGTACRAGEAGCADLIPPPKAAARPLRVRLGLLVVHWDRKVLLLPPGSGPVAVPDRGEPPVRKDISGLHRGLWGLPATPWLPGGPVPGPAWPGAIWRPFLDALPFGEVPGDPGDPELLGRFRHAITKYRLEILVYGLTLPGTPPGSGDVHLPLPEMLSEPGRLSRWPSPEEPISNLVNKSLYLAVERGI